MIFLGLDEKKKTGFEYTHKGTTIGGAPYFALDITPRGSVSDVCEKLIEGLKSKGLSFTPGRGMDLVATDGELSRQVLARQFQYTLN